MTVLNQIGCGTWMIVGGLLLDAVGVVFTLWAMVSVRNEQIYNEANLLHSSYYGREYASQEERRAVMMRTSYAKGRVRERCLVRLGVTLLVAGFAIQAVGTMISSARI